MALPRGSSDERNTNPGKDAASVTAGVPFPAGVCRALWVGGAGNITVTMEAGTSVSFNGIQAGTWMPIQCTVVSAATATDIVAVF